MSDNKLPVIKLMSFNTQHCLNFLEQKIDFDCMANAIKMCDADIVGLNEMRDKGVDPAYDRQVAILSERTEMEHWYFAKAIDVNGENPYGNGLLSKLPIMKAETILIPPPDPAVYHGDYERRCILKAVLEGGITVLVTHFDLSPEEHENAVKTVLKYLEPQKCILMGDFNLRPDNAALSPIRERMQDAASRFSTPLYSFPSDHPDRKIDYIFVSPDIDVITADIPAIIASDHRPHTATIKIRDI